MFPVHYNVTVFTAAGWHVMVNVVVFAIVVIVVEQQTITVKSVIRISNYHMTYAAAHSTDLCCRMPPRCKLPPRLAGELASWFVIVAACRISCIGVTAAEAVPL